MDPNLLNDVTESYARLTETELTNIGIVLGAYRSFRGNRRDHIGYISMPITTGRRYFEVLTAHGVRTSQELEIKCGPTALFEEVIKPNIQEGIEFADQFGQRENLLYIAPSVFEAKRWRWSQDAYMSLWYRVLGEMAGKHVLMDDWEYSVGGLKEYMFSMFMQWRCIRPFTEQMAVQEFGLKNLLPDMSPMRRMEEYQAMWSIRTFDASGNEIRIDQGLTRIVAAIQDLTARGFDSKEMINIAWKIMLTPMLSPYVGKGPYDAITETYSKASDTLKTLVPPAQES